MSVKNNTKELRRKCFKCGCSPFDDANIKLYRFPKPGTTNSLRCVSWAKYCFPNRDCHLSKLHSKLYTEHRMLCNKHFKDTSFIDYPTSMKILRRFAVPEDDNDGVDLDECSNQGQSSGSRPFHTEHNYFNPLKGVSDVQSITLTVNADTDSIVHKEKYNEVIQHHKGKLSLEFFDEWTKTTDQQFQGRTLSESEERSRVVFTANADTQTEEIQREPALFSWQADSSIVCDEDVVESCTDAWQEEDLSMYNDDKPNTDNKSEDVYRNQPQIHEGYKCNDCNSGISGFRYTCVQCEDYDLCEACEASRGHSHHYMLRVPGPRPQGEVKLILDTIRKILNESMVDINNELLNSIKDEADETVNEQDPLEGLTTHPVSPDCTQSSHVGTLNMDIDLTDDAAAAHSKEAPNKDHNIRNPEAFEDKNISAPNNIDDSDSENMEEMWLDEDFDTYDIENDMTQPKTTEYVSETDNNNSANSFMPLQNTSLKSKANTERGVIKIKCVKSKTVQDAKKCFVVVKDVFKNMKPSQVSKLKIKDIECKISSQDIEKQIPFVSYKNRKLPLSVAINTNSTHVVNNNITFMSANASGVGIKNVTPHANRSQTIQNITPFSTNSSHNVSKKVISISNTHRVAILKKNIKLAPTHRHRSNNTSDSTR
ncbi:uncharacterized protein LOC131851679 [Achroia grisella]|uniref:uncharacterized protein LOC131851679 n=1 Tax=Achroia grisella TaxID=688607 RepID=UPI0027D33509|nr:uncharacterized protein LOC131851679 [Achroia grisella]